MLPDRALIFFSVFLDEFLLRFPLQKSGLVASSGAGGISVRTSVAWVWSFLDSHILSLIVPFFVYQLFDSTFFPAPAAVLPTVGQQCFSVWKYQVDGIHLTGDPFADQPNPVIFSVIWAFGIFIHPLSHRLWDRQTAPALWLLHKRCHRQDQSTPASSWGILSARSS